MLDTSFGVILTVAAFVLGILLLTGHGDFLLSGTGSEERRKIYDMDKLSKASGIAMIFFGIATGIDCFTVTPAAKIIYTLSIIVIFALMVFYIQKKCKKSK